MTRLLRSPSLLLASLAVGLLTMFSMTKIWAGAFWGEPEQEPSSTPRTSERLGGPVGVVGATALLGVASIAVSLWAGPIYDIAERAGADLLEPSRYVDAILGTGP